MVETTHRKKTFQSIHPAATTTEHRAAWQLCISQVKVLFLEIKVDIAFRSIIQAWMMLTSMMMTQSMSKADWMLAWAEDQRRLCT